MYSGTFVPLLAGQAWAGNTKSNRASWQLVDNQPFLWELRVARKERHLGKNYRYKFIGLLGHERQNKSVAM